MADAGKFVQACLRSALGHRTCGLAREQVGVGAAQQEGRTRDGVVCMPEHRFALRGRLRRDGAKRQRDIEVVVAAIARAIAAGIAFLAHQHRQRERDPLLARVRAEAGRDAAQVVGRLVHAGPALRHAEIGADALDRFELDLRPDIVEHQAADRRALLRGEQHAHEAAHRSADPVEPARIQARQQRHHVGQVGGDLVAVRIGQAVRPAAPDHVGADHAIGVAQRAGQGVEIAPLAREAVHAHQHARVRWVAPLPVRHAVQAAGVEALNEGQARFGHEDSLGRKAHVVLDNRS